jgi:hypothetical protein
MNREQKAALEASLIALVYMKKGRAVTEFDYKEWLDKVLERYGKKEPWTYFLCTELPFMVIRKEIAEKRICYHEVAFILEKGKVHRCGPDGLFLEKPQHAFNGIMNCLMKLGASLS